MKVRCNHQLFLGNIRNGKFELNAELPIVVSAGKFDSVKVSKLLPERSESLNFVKAGKFDNVNELILLLQNAHEPITEVLARLEIVNS